MNKDVNKPFTLFGNCDHYHATRQLEYALTWNPNSISIMELELEINCLTQMLVIPQFYLWETWSLRTSQKLNPKHVKMYSNELSYCLTIEFFFLNLCPPLNIITVYGVWIWVSYTIITWKKDWIQWWRNRMYLNQMPTRQQKRSEDKKEQDSLKVMKYEKMQEAMVSVLPC